MHAHCEASATRYALLDKIMPHTFVLELARYSCFHKEAHGRGQASRGLGVARRIALPLHVSGERGTPGTIVRPQGSALVHG